MIRSPCPTICPFGRLALAGAIALAMVAAQARGDTVFTDDGKTYEGTTAILASGQLSVTGGDGRQVKIDLEHVLYASFPVTVPVARSEFLGPLSIHDIGMGDVKSSTVFTRGFYCITGKGAGFGSTSDAIHMVGQGVHGNSDISARINDVNAAQARAGISFRESDKADARQVSLMITQENLHLLVRSGPGRALTTIALGKVSVPVYLRLTRSDESFSAYSSKDGSDWKLLAGETAAGEGSVKVPSIDSPMAAGALAGLVLTGNADGAAASATFDRVSVHDDAPVLPHPVESHAPRVRALRQTDWMKGVQLNEGTFLAGATLAADGAKWKLAWREQSLAIETAQISRMQKQAISPAVLDRIPEDSFLESVSARSPGVLLNTGDFLAGRITAFTADRVEVNNIVLGLSPFTFDQVFAVALGRPANPERGFRVQLVDGSVLMARSLNPTPRGELQVDDFALGKLVVPTSEILSVRRTAGLLPAADLPWNLEGPRDADVEALSCFDRSGPFWLARSGLIAENGLVQPAGDRLSCRIPSGLTRFQSTVAVPARLGTAAKLVFVIAVDGKEAFRSPVLCSRDAPLPVVVSLKDAHTLSLQVEEAPGNSGQAFGTWGNALLIP